MSVINSGELNERLKILKKISIDNGRGQKIHTGELLYNLRCKRKTISTKEFVNADQHTSEDQLKFIIRNRNVDNLMVIKYKDKYYDISHVHEIDKLFLEITAIEDRGADYGADI